MFCTELLNCITYSSKGLFHSKVDCYQQTFSYELESIFLVYNAALYKSNAYGLTHKHAVQLGTATANRCIDEKLVSNLRKYHGVYYLVDPDKTPEENLEIYGKEKEGRA